MRCVTWHQVDTRHEAVLVPIYGVLTPFHVLTVKNATVNQVRECACSLESCCWDSIFRILMVKRVRPFIRSASLAVCWTTLSMARNSFDDNLTSCSQQARR